MKQKIYFLAPQNTWGTYYYYKNISDYLIKYYSHEYDVYFCNSFLDYIKLHFIKTDFVFSIIPFLFRPIRTRKYFFNPHWNYKVERRNKWLWVKILYLTELNLLFCNKIILTSYFLSDTLHFREKYNSKIQIIPNFVAERIPKINLDVENKYNFLTITSFDFKKKWDGVISLLRVIQKLWNTLENQKITFSIAWKREWKNYEKVYSIFKEMTFPDNVIINWLWWINKEDMTKNFLMHNTFLYWSGLDNTPWVILDAMNYNRKIYTNNFESFSYIVPEECICHDEDEMLEKILEDEVCIDAYTFYDTSEVAKKLLKFIEKN